MRRGRKSEGNSGSGRNFFFFVFVFGTDTRKLTKVSKYQTENGGRGRSEDVATEGETGGRSDVTNVKGSRGTQEREKRRRVLQGTRSYKRGLGTSRKLPSFPGTEVDPEVIYSTFKVVTVVNLGESKQTFRNPK